MFRQTRLNIQEIAMPAASAAPVASSSAAAEEAPAEEKPKEKTIFTVKLEAFDAAAKPKIIKEVKAMNPTFTLVAVCFSFRLSSLSRKLTPDEFDRPRTSSSPSHRR